MQQEKLLFYDNWMLAIIDTFAKGTTISYEQFRQRHIIIVHDNLSILQLKLICWIPSLASQNQQQEYKHSLCKNQLFFHTNNHM